MLRKLKRRGGDVWRAYSPEEAFRAIFAGDLTVEQAAELIDRRVSRASRSRRPAFVKASKTIRKHRDGVLAALRLGINNARAEGLDSVVRLTFARARGFPIPEAALALILLTCGPITLHLPTSNAASATDNPHSCREGLIPHPRHQATNRRSTELMDIQLGFAPSWTAGWTDAGHLLPFVAPTRGATVIITVGTDVNAFRPAYAP